MKSFSTIVIGLVFFSCHALYAFDVVEEGVRISMNLKSLFGTKSINLSATIYRLNVDEKLPLVVLNHGTPRNPKERKNSIKMREQSKVFVEKGFISVVAMRRGYGESQGEEMR